MDSIKNIYLDIFLGKLYLTTNSMWWVVLLFKIYEKFWWKMSLLMLIREVNVSPELLKLLK